MHIAAALDVPIVAIYGPDDPLMTHPYTSPERYIIVKKDLECQPCNKSRCDKMTCLKEITVDEVFEAVCRLLNPDRNRLQYRNS